jgi:hypothetical protein
MSTFLCNGCGELGASGEKEAADFMRSARKSTIQLLRLRFIVCSADTRIQFDHGFVDMIRALPGTNGSMHLSNRCH